jgi:putative transposase
VRAHQASYPVQTMCRVLEISRSGYYAWLEREPSDRARRDAELTERIYLAVVLDVWSRRIVGWAMATHLRTELVLDAMNMALAQRRPESVIHHSDQGSQYTSIAFGLRCLQAGVRPSMGSVGDCYDNAMCESFFATLECELLDQHSYRTQAEARLSVFDFIEGWYNPHRRHSALGQISPCEFERRHVTAAPANPARAPRAFGASAPMAGR